MGKLNQGRSKLQDRLERKRDPEAVIGRRREKSSLLFKGLMYAVLGAVVTGGVLLLRRNG